MNTRKSTSVIKNLWPSLAGIALALSLASPLNAGEIGSYQSVPPLLAESAAPLVMLALSNDHQLHYKSFTDWDDLDGDGLVDTTYKSTFEYVGYFDSHKCYTYSTTNTRFEPAGPSGSNFYCNGYATAASNIEWSGNFLNWATMTRIDQVRKVLYGGLRSTDTSSVTVLERSFLPNDAHSFAKYYNGTDLGRLTPFGQLTTGNPTSSSSGITICNTTKHSSNTGWSQTSTAPPLARVVAGNYALWAANERWQCMYSGEINTGNNRGSNLNSSSVSGIYANANSPATTNQAAQRDGVTIGDYVVRVRVCVSGNIGQEDCKQYPSNNFKPIGILQRFGDDESVMWGLLTGSYKKSKSGGVLRKNIGKITDEINVATTGTFKAAPTGGGIINTINLLRIVNYQYDYTGTGNNAGTYNNASGDNCEWGKNTFNDGSCTNWGNPFAEILLECYRYFANKSPNPAFHADDSSLLAGLTTQGTWTNPQTADTACASLNVIAFNASTISYDGDQLGGISDLNTLLTAKQWTKKVGDGEGITGNTYFVGESGTANNQLCTAKQVNDLGEVEGTCPDAPRLDGTYNSVGLAYLANTTDMRPDLPGRQTVTTYGVTLAQALPNVALTSPAGARVNILPACRNTHNQAPSASGTRVAIGGNCGLVDFKIVEQNVTPTGSTGRFYVNWEDSEQGGDYDQDMAGILSYELTATQLKITTNVIVQSTPNQLGFGFVVSGTAEDGFHSISGINEYTGFGCGTCRSTDAAATKTFTLGSSTATLLEQPLFYAAKWGGFVDLDGDGKPSHVREWDQRNNTTGASASDGVPDNYFLAINPRQLRDQLTSILVNILERTASSTSAAVVTSTGTGEGAVYQALYNPRFSDAHDIESVEWVGTLNALFIDRFGNFREDSAAPYGQLTDADNIITVRYNPVAKQTQVQRYAFDAEMENGIGETIGTPVDVLQLQPIWNARKELGRVMQFTTQRNYGAVPDNGRLTGRHILTGIANAEGAVELQPFLPGTFTTGNLHRLLGLADTDINRMTKATNIVNFTRGAHVAGFRNRRLDLNGDGTLEPILLADIVHSSPVAVGRPTAAYDITFGDVTYRQFRERYQNRRQVIYVGANGGMLHAFNGGFYNPAQSRYELSRDGATAHPLGAELWGYVPYNLLPHLQWLTMPSYPHVYYMDGSVKSYDVNIFPASETHVGGWGTILVAGMRFGGGDFTVPSPHGDGPVTLRSGYVIFDITDPEQPPKLLAEITHPDMGFTVGEPALVKHRVADANGSYANASVNRWFLTFGSGPAGSSDQGRTDALRKAISDKSAKLFVYDLQNKTLAVHNTGEAASFVGGVQSADWSRDYRDDAIYFGTVGGTVDQPTGKLMRGRLGLVEGDLNVQFSQVLGEEGQPFSATPLTVRDQNGDYWVYTGTGRFYVVDDNFSTRRQSYYGVREPRSGASLAGSTVELNSLVNTTDIRVFTDGTIDSRATPGADIMLPPLTDPARTFADVHTAVQYNQGWFFDFIRQRGRNINQAVVAGQSLVFTEYQPSGLKCEPEGNGYLHAPHLQAGIPGVFAPLGTNPNSTNADDAQEVNADMSLGLGSPSSPAIHLRGDGQNVAVVQTSTGELSNTLVNSGTLSGKRESWRELDSRGK